MKKEEGCTYTFLTLCINDLLNISKDLWGVNKVNNLLSCEFVVKDFKEVEYCLGIEVKMVDWLVKNRWLAQPKYIHEMLLWFGMSTCKLVYTWFDRWMSSFLQYKKPWQRRNKNDAIHSFEKLLVDSCTWQLLWD